jgi:hypothetical protein
MPNIPCPIFSPCSDPSNPITNYSSEAPDQEVFLGFGSTVIQPTAGHPFDNGGGYFYCSSTVSQDAADLCGYSGAIDNGPDSGGTSNNPPPNTGNDSGNWGSQIFWNDAQTASVTCPDGGTFTYTLPAMSVRALSVIYANRIALSIATIRANRFLICISNVSAACLGEAYDQTITASTETPGDITWQLRSGVVPPGLAFDFSDPDTSVIGLVGTPTLSGNFTFVLRATDSLGNFTDKTVVMAVLGLTNSPTTATVGAPYSFQFSAAGGVAPYFFSINSGSLPTGLSLSSTGLISGTPTSSTSNPFTVELEDSHGNTCFFPYTISFGGCQSVINGLVWGAPVYGAGLAGTFTGAGGAGSFATHSTANNQLSTVTVDIPIHNTTPATIRVHVGVVWSGNSPSNFGGGWFKIFIDGSELADGINHVAFPAPDSFNETLPPWNLLVGPPPAPDFDIGPGITGVLQLWIRVNTGTAGDATNSGNVTITCV